MSLEIGDSSNARNNGGSEMTTLLDSVHSTDKNLALSIMRGNQVGNLQTAQADTAADYLARPQILPGKGIGQEKLELPTPATVFTTPGIFVPPQETSNAHQGIAPDIGVGAQDSALQKAKDALEHR